MSNMSSLVLLKNGPTKLVMEVPACEEGQSVLDLPIMITTISKFRDPFQTLSVTRSGVFTWRAHIPVKCTAVGAIPEP